MRYETITCFVIPEKCVNLIAQKDQLISDLKSELKTGDERFVKDQRKQGEDVALLVERIDNQIAIMRRAYRRELILIEVAITFVLFKTVFSIFIASFIKKTKSTIQSL